MSEAVSPLALAAHLNALPTPRLIVFDCDGVLAPIVDHADDAVLAPGVRDSLAALADADATRVAVVSGRSLAGLAQFDLPDTLEVFGSYGAERRGRDASPLPDESLGLLSSLIEIAELAADDAGAGAWVERKPASVVLHVREADAGRGSVALRRVRDDAQRLRGVFVHEGKMVVELSVAHNDKGRTIETLADEQLPASVVYIGDDEPDEAAFEAVNRMQVPGVSIRVGFRDDTSATHTIPDAASVPTLLAALTSI